MFGDTNYLHLSWDAPPTLAPTGQADSWDVPSLVEFRGVDQLLRQQGEATQELRRRGSQWDFPKKVPL